MLPQSLFARIKLHYVGKTLCLTLDTGQFYYQSGIIASPFSRRDRCYGYCLKYYVASATRPLIPENTFNTKSGFVFQKTIFL